MAEEAGYDVGQTGSVLDRTDWMNDGGMFRSGEEINMSTLGTKYEIPVVPNTLRTDDIYQHQYDI